MEAYVLAERNAGAWEALFGLVLHALYDAGVASDVAVTAWVEGCEEGRGGPRVAGLLQSKWTQRLLALLDEESDDEEEEGDEEEEEGDDDD